MMLNGSISLNGYMVPGFIGDPFLFYYNGDASYPGVSRDDIVQQVPVLNKKYLSYTSALFCIKSI